MIFVHLDPSRVFGSLLGPRDLGDPCDGSRYTYPCNDPCGLLCPRGLALLVQCGIPTARRSLCVAIARHVSFLQPLHVSTCEWLVKLHLGSTVKILTDPTHPIVFVYYTCTLCNRIVLKLNLTTKKKKVELNTKHVLLNM